MDGDAQAKAARRSGVLMSGAAAEVERGRRAYDDRAWGAAYAALSSADEDDPLAGHVPYLGHARRVAQRIQEFVGLRAG